MNYILIVLVFRVFHSTAEQTLLVWSAHWEWCPSGHRAWYDRTKLAVLLARLYPSCSVALMLLVAALWLVEWPGTDVHNTYMRTDQVDTWNINNYHNMLTASSTVCHSGHTGNIRGLTCLVHLHWQLLETVLSVTWIATPHFGTTWEILHYCVVWNTTQNNKHLGCVYACMCACVWGWDKLSDYHFICTSLIINSCSIRAYWVQVYVLLEYSGLYI